MKKIFTLCAAVLFAGMTFAATDTREVITNYVFSGYDLRTIQIGFVWNSDASEEFTNAIVPQEGAPYYLSVTMTNLFRKNNDDTYTKVQSNEELTAGVYRFEMQLRIDGDYGTQYRVPDKDKIESSATVKINGQKWVVTNQYATIQSNYSYFWIKSPDFKLIDLNMSEISLWQELWFTETVDQGKMDGKEFTAFGDFVSLTPVDPDGKMSVDGNTARFGTPLDSASYKFRLKTGGTSTDSKTYLKINVPADGQLRIAARTGKNAENRSLILQQNGVTLYNALLSEDDTISTEGKRFYPYIYVKVEQGELTISSFMNGINIYEIAFRGEAEYGTDFNFPFGNFMMGSIGFTIDAYPEEYVGGDITDGLLLMIERLDVFGDFNTHDLYDPRELLTSYIFKDGHRYKIIAAEGTINKLSDELISLYGKFLCNDLKIYNIQALIQVKPEGMKNVQGDKVQSTKVIRNGQLLIERNGRTYNANGIEVK